MNIQYRTTNLVCTLYPILTGVHVKDKHICISPDILIKTAFCEFKPDDTMNDNLKALHKLFVEELLTSNGNQAGCKHYVHGLFIAYLEKYVKNPLVINSFLIGNNEQILIQVQEKNEASYDWSSIKYLHPTYG